MSQLIQKIRDEKTGTLKRITKSEKGFFVLWNHADGTAENAGPFETLTEATITAAYNSKADAEK